jgi:hypothetical protein
MKDLAREIAGVAILLLVLLTLASAATRAVWPPDRHPLAIDAKTPGCPRSAPAPKSFAPAPLPLNDTRRIA